VLIAILIGFYGNWYFNLWTRLEKSQEPIIWAVLGASAFSLFIYCIEAIYWKQTFLKLPRSTWMAVIHAFTTLGLIGHIENWDVTPPKLIGLFLWMVIINYERRVRYSF